jgi:acetylornithine/succinyldiaminopimelate/putrescine aminotransferase
LISASRNKGTILHQKLTQFITKYPDLVTEVRGRGLMLALAFKNDPAPLVKKLRDAGLLVVGAGGLAIRFLPPLNVKEAEIEQAISIVDSILSTFIPDEASK